MWSISIGSTCRISLSTCSDGQYCCCSSLLYGTVSLKKVCLLSSLVSNLEFSRFLKFYSLVAISSASSNDFGPSLSNSIVEIQRVAKYIGHLYFLKIIGSFIWSFGNASSSKCIFLSLNNWTLSSGRCRIGRSQQSHSLIAFLIISLNRPN